MLDKNPIMDSVLKITAQEIREDFLRCKMRPFTQQEFDWFWSLQKLRILVEKDIHVPFPEAWKHFDDGLTPEKTLEIYEQNRMDTSPGHKK